MVLFRELWQDHANLPPNKSSELRYDAYKIIRKENNDEMLEFIRAGIDLMSRINHEHIIKLHDYQVAWISNIMIVTKIVQAFKVVDNSWFIRMELMEVKIINIKSETSLNRLRFINIKSKRNKFFNKLSECILLIFAFLWCFLNAFFHRSAILNSNTFR